MKFSIVETRDLLKAWIVISLAFAILLGDLRTDFGFLIIFAIAASTVGIGFLLHELAHKYFAQKYGAWAEFRSFDAMLMIALVLSFFGVIFAAPGAVFIKGKVSRKQNGIISLAGPATNFLIAALFFVIYVSTSIPLLQLAGKYGTHINTWLGFFNLLPIFGLDGSKVLAWDKRIYAASILIALALVVWIHTF